MKIKENLLEIIGVALIVGLSLLSIFFSSVERELVGTEYEEIASYASFFENRFLDSRSQRAINNTAIDTHSVLIRVDDETLQKIGTWPLPRTVWSSLIRKLRAYNTKVISFDIMFPEKSLACGEESPDKELSEAIKEFQTDHTNIILAYTVSDEENNSTFKDFPDELYEFMLKSNQRGDVGFRKDYVNKHSYPIKEFLADGANLGFINMSEDSDGIFRSYKLAANVDGFYLPSMALRTFEAYTGSKTKLDINIAGTGTLSTNKGELEVNNNGEAKIRWFGENQNFYNISLWKVLEAKDDDKKMHELFKNKIAFIGSTAVGAHDLRHTPINAKMPGVYAHMNMTHMLTDNLQYQKNIKSIYASYTVLAISMICLLMTMYFGNAVIDLIMTVTLCSLIYLVDIKFLILDGYELKLVFTFFSLIGTYSWLTFSNFNKSSKEKKQIKGAFSRYVAPSIVNDMLSNPDKLKVGGERRDITCLFSDVRDFTSISEKLSATELAKCLNRYMGEMTDIVFETNGTLDKYIGDAIVAFWGAPLDLESHEDKALEAAVKMLEALPAINQEFKQQGYPEFKIGLGLNSGECNVGNMGSDTIFAYTALGDNMNLGARLESLCKHYGAQILISTFTYDRIDKQRFKCRKIDNAQVKGKEQGVGVYEVLYSYHPIMMDSYSYDNFIKAYELFEQKDFQAAKDLFSKVLESHPTDEPTNKLMKRTLGYIENPPEEGSNHTLTRMTSK